MRSRGPGSTLSLVQLLLGFLALFQQQQICLVEKHLVLFSSPEQEFGFSSGSKPGEPLSLRMNGGWQGSARCHVGPAARFHSRCTVISFPGSRALPLLRAAQRSLFSHQRLRSRCCRGHSYAAFLVLCCLGREPEPFRLLSMCAVAGHSRASYFQRFCSFLRLRLI